jgi:hypothetical protein
LSCAASWDWWQENTDADPFWNMTSPHASLTIPDHYHLGQSTIHSSRTRFEDLRIFLWG